MTNTEKTLFEKIVAGEIPCTKIYEDADTFAFLDIHPASPGHTLLIPKLPYKNIHELPDEVACILIKNTKKISGAISHSLNATGIKLVMNNGTSAGQVIFHAHIHIIPQGTSAQNSNQKAEDIAAKIRAEIK